MASAKDRSVSILAGAVIAAAIPFVTFVARFWWTCDDAFISFRYAQHLARGDGLTFNPGESPPVEGFTNLGWTLYLACFQWFGANLPLVANLTSSAAGLLLIALVVAFVREQLDGDLTTTVTTGLFLATLPPLVLWSGSGLETMPFALGVFGTFFFLRGEPDRRRTLLAAACACDASLMRADGPLWTAFVFAAVLLPWFAHRRGAVLRAVLTAGAILTVVVLAQFLWRKSYFGQWLPNTASIKAGFTERRLARGWNYLVSTVLAVPVLALVPATALACLGGARRRLALQAGCFVLLGVAYPVFVGGDFMAMGRFFVPVLPFVAVLFAICVRTVRVAVLGWVYAGLMIALSCAGLYDALPVSPELRQRFHFRWNGPEARSEIEQWAFMKQQAENWTLLGRALGLYTKPGESLIRGNIGAVGYHSELVFLDLNGLVIPEVAAAAQPREVASPGHDRKVDESFFFDRHPTYRDAVLMPANAAPQQVLPDYILRDLRAGRLKLERTPLDPARGFPPGVELWMLRFIWDR